MLEIPESYAISKQISAALSGRTIAHVVANASPHGFAWFHGTPEAYPALLAGRIIESAKPVGGNIQIAASGATLIFGDGVNLRLYAPDKKRPPKHQLLLELDDGSALIGSVQMYGSLVAYPEDYVNENPYYLGALQKPSPLTDAFDKPYFMRLFTETKDTLSVKAFLATEQRIPGLGNGVLQDILYMTGLHPARAIRTLDDAQVEGLYQQVKILIKRMAELGGRDTEKDLFAKPGGYRTLLSRKTLMYPCPRCGGPIVRKAYLGGNVYFCPQCQPKE